MKVVLSLQRTLTQRPQHYTLSLPRKHRFVHKHKHADAVNVSGHMQIRTWCAKHTQQPFVKSTFSKLSNETTRFQTCLSLRCQSWCRAHLHYLSSSSVLLPPSQQYQKKDHTVSTEKEWHDITPFKRILFTTYVYHCICTLKHAPVLLLFVHIVFWKCRVSWKETNSLQRFTNYLESNYAVSWLQI